MRSIRYGISVTLMALAPLAAQEIKLPPALGAHASETVEVTLDSNTLQFASKFLSGSNPNEVQVKKLVAGLKSIMVRSFEYDKPGQYSAADVESVRAQFRGTGWSRAIGVDSKKESEISEVYLKSQNGMVAGLGMISAEPKELTIIHINGSIDPGQLSQLGGKFGIPKIDLGKKRKTGKED